MDMWMCIMRKIINFCTRAIKFGAILALAAGLSGCMYKRYGYYEERADIGGAVGTGGAVIGGRYEYRATSRPHYRYDPRTDRIVVTNSGAEAQTVVMNEAYSDGMRVRREIYVTPGTTISRTTYPYYREYPYARRVRPIVHRPARPPRPGARVMPDRRGDMRPAPRRIGEPRARLNEGNKARQEARKPQTRAEKPDKAHPENRTTNEKRPPKPENSAKSPKPDNSNNGVSRE